MAAALLLLSAAACAGHGPGTAAAPAPAASAYLPRTRPPTADDIAFMTGMIHHHAQAVLMAGWAPDHGASPAIQALCQRIVVGQEDEIRLMQRWLHDWGQPVPDAQAAHDMMPGMEHHLMPGMLTAEELQQLDQSRGAEFDRLFLTGMIRHHQGALTMVQTLVNSPGGARDDAVFKFVSDMNADQTIEIERMEGMLAQVLSAGAGPG